MNKMQERFSRQLKKALDIRGMKAIELSKKTGIPKSSISQYMSGYTMPRLDKFFVIADTLGVDAKWLLGFDVPIEK